MEVIHVLRDEQEIFRVVSKSRDCFMRAVWLRIADAPAPFAVPIPNQFRVACEGFRCREFRRIKIPPVAISATKSRYPTFSRNTCASQNKDPHNLNSTTNRAFQIFAQQFLYQDG
jgi:hypothetical protein